ncbi:sugar transferase [Roseivirga echinicomitans]
MYLIIKRLIDFFGALALTLILIPVWLPIIMVLWLTGEHCVFYLQDRIGKRQKVFKIWKFATMIKNSPSIGTGSLTLRDDPRVTKVGKFLRKTKINELPQLVNVLIGNMSFVGPRPQMKVDFEIYTDTVKEAISQMKPGITGIGSVFFRDEEKDISNAKDPRAYYVDIIAPKKGGLEVWYVNNFSFFTDIKLLFLTFIVIFFPNWNTVIYTVFPDLKNE